jgi:parallel beta-helix repeat protein
MVDWQGKECKLENALKFENAKASLFGLYLSEQATVRTESISMEIKGTAHGPIHINGNGQFTSANGVTGGSGTQSNPYIIENWDIDAKGGTYCIWIENTDVWFVIQNCRVLNATNTSSEPYGTGIYLNNVTHGTLKNNNCSGNSRNGICLWNSNNNTIMNNNCTNNSYDGIQMYSSNNNTIMNNNCTNNSYYGIALQYSNNNTVTNNTCSQNYCGISVDTSSYNNTITKNNCAYNSYGMRVSSSSNNITNNICSYNSYHGLWLVSSSNNITNNNCSYNFYYGLYLDSLNYNNNITNNNFYHNNYSAIYINANSANNTIHHNNFWRNNGAGKGVNGNCQAYDKVGGNYWYDNTTKEGNYWSNWDGNGWGTSSAYPINGGAGASDWYPLSKPTLKPLYINGNLEFAFYAGLYGWPGDGTVTNPYRINGYYINANASGTPSAFGIWVENTSAWFVVSNCTIKNATNGTVFPYGAGLCMRNVTNGKAENNILVPDRCGIYLVSSSYNTITNNYCPYNSWSIYLYSSNYNTITNNICSYNYYYGMYMSYSSYNTIANNNCSGNSYDGIYLDSSTNNNITNNNIYQNTNYGICLYTGSTGNTIYHNNFWRNNGAGRGVNGNCQAYDVGGGNTWYNNNAKEGNYWSNWDGNGWGTSSAYPIAGTAGASDYYPLSKPALQPLHINGNAEFAFYAGLYGWSGDGTVTNPYRINGYYINANVSGTPSTFGIWVENTNAWFVVSNCTIKNATNDTVFPYGTGLCMRNVTNGKAENNTITMERIGIYLYSSSYNTITNNICTYNSYEGTYMYNASNNIISNNICSYDKWGIYMYSSHNNTITNNNYSYNSQYGISLVSSNNNNITNNNIYQNTIYGVYIYTGSTGNTIYHNNFWRNNGAGRGVNGNCQAYDVGGGNTWYNNNAKEGNYWSNWDGNGWGTSSAYPIAGTAGASDYYPLSKPALQPLHINGNAEFAFYAGLYGWSGDGTVTNPYRINGYYINANVSGTPSTFGIWVENTNAWFVVSNCTIKNATNDTVFPYGTGLCMRNVTNGKAENNTITMERIGIYLYSSSYNTITNNYCSYNYWYGIDLSYSSYNTIANNNCSGNYYGVSMYYSSNNTITNNNIYQNTNYGIRLYTGSTGNTIYHNNFYQNNGAGRGVNGNCQAYDGVGGNIWYNNSAKEGNYWSNWDGNGWGTSSAYPIDGGKASDWYPWGGPTPELSPFAVLVVAIVMLGTVALRRSK